MNARGDGDKALINVTDTGIGISPEDAVHVFQKFYRVDNSQTRSIGGTGLGLYLVKQRVEALGGRVWVESAFGEGSTFFVSLPRLSDAEYERLRLAYQNSQAVQAFKSAPAAAPVIQSQQIPVPQAPQTQQIPVASVQSMTPAQPQAPTPPVTQPQLQTPTPSAAPTSPMPTAVPQTATVPQQNVISPVINNNQKGAL